jgi:hypothetical protein
MATASIATTPAPFVATTVASGSAFPPPPPSYPKAGPLGMLAVAIAYFAIGVAVGALLKQSARWRPVLPFIVVPGVLAGLGFLLWVLKTLR